MITAFLDANVLYPVTQRAVLMELARADAFGPLWTEAVHQEWMRNLAAKEPHIKPAQIARLRALMEAYVGNVMVTGYVLSALADDRADLVNPPLSVDQYLAILERGGLATTALALRQFADRL